MKAGRGQDLYASSTPGRLIYAGSRRAIEGHGAAVLAKEPKGSHRLSRRHRHYFLQEGRPTPRSPATAIFLRLWTSERYETRRREPLHGDCSATRIYPLERVPVEYKGSFKGELGPLGWISRTSYLLAPGKVSSIDSSWGSMVDFVAESFLCRGSSGETKRSLDRSPWTGRAGG